jgi:hypothetical protein
MVAVLLVVAAGVLPQDTAARLVRQAQRAEADYELVARTRAPVTFERGGTNCDELVGRFCLTFDRRGEAPELPPEPPAIGEARDRAIQALSRAAGAAPRDGRTARGLVRLLVEAHEDSAAVSAAGRYAAAAGDSWGELLLGFAQHAAGDDTAAARHFRAGLADLPERERRRLDPEHLLSRDEAHALGRLDSTARAGYQAALWKLGDPLYLTPGNEVLAEHQARYVWVRMLAELPLVHDMTSWHSDLEELTFRYGTPIARQRVPARMWEDADGIVEHFDSTALAFLPESLLTVGVRPTPPPGETWTLADPVARSGYAARMVRRVAPLLVQVTRFPLADSVVLRVDGALPLDSLARAAGPDSVRVGLFILEGWHRLLRGDTSVVRTATGLVRPRGDTARFTLSVTLPPGQYVYSAEAIESGSRLAGRARYAVTLLAASPGGPPFRTVMLSDVLLARPFRRVLPRGRDAPGLHGLSEPVASPGDTLGLYAEASGLAPGPFRVALDVTRVDAPPVATRVLGWLRARLGGSRPDPGVRLSWMVDSPAAGPVGLGDGTSPEDEAAARGADAAIATDLVLPRLPAGLYAVRLRVTAANGASTSSRRILRIHPVP